MESAYTLICKVHAKREVRSKDGKLDTMMYYLNDGIFGAFAGMFYYPEEVAPELYLVRREVCSNCFYHLTTFIFIFYNYFIFINT